ncbi:class II fructose-bisphosphate aldolase [Caproiciproducens sp.]
MLVTLKEVLKIAEAEKCAIGSFNTPSLESVMAVIGAAEELGTPVILMHAEIHEQFTPLSVIGPVMLGMANRAKIPVCVHLDHGVTLSYLQEALQMGFTSIMYDGSMLSYERNVANTCIAVEMARKTGASVEGEIGVLGKDEMGTDHTEKNGGPTPVYTNPDDAGRFVRETGIDALACSFGTVHGIYLKKPQLDMGVLERVRAKADVPLVMHGGSGVSDADYKRAIQNGIRKVNYYTYMAKAGGEAVAEKIKENQGEIIYYHDIARWGIDAMKENVKKAMKVFAGLD